jgi:3-oxoacyl-[acyl-carrier-protein] synthase-3
MDGSRGNALMIPAGGLRMPAKAETAIMEEDEDKNIRSKEHLIMEGRNIFTFVQTEVPPLISELLEYADTDKDKIDYFLFHQPNRFMLQKLADSLKIDYCKMPNNSVGKFGNSSGVTVPVNITYNLSSQLINDIYNVCLAGFGSGLAWGAMLLKLGKMDFCQTIEYKTTSKRYQDIKKGKLRESAGRKVMSLMHKKGL